MQDFCSIGTYSFNWFIFQKRTKYEEKLGFEISNDIVQHFHSF